MRSRRWSRNGQFKIILLTIIWILSFTAQSHAIELWNIVNPPDDKPVDESNVASAAALSAIALGFDAFRRSEIEGLAARKEQLGAAGGQMMDAANLMAKTLEKFRAVEFSKELIPYTELDSVTRESIEFWAASRKLGRPLTKFDLYSQGAAATEDLAVTYKSLSGRDDARVFDEFIDATFGYVRAGSAATRVLKPAK